MSPERALGNIALATDGGQCAKPKSPDGQRQPHLDNVEEIFTRIQQQSDPTLFHILLTIVFELSSKLEYVYLATREYASQADPQLAAMIATHAERLESFDRPEAVDWEGKMLEAHRIFHRLLDQIDPEHRAALQAAAAPALAQIRAEENALLGELSSGTEPKQAE